MGVIDDIKARLDIVELIGESVSLRKTGRSYLGFCPFHDNTRTPAFNVYPDTQSFYCFGCQASGTVFDFVMRQHGLEFREALELLAPRAGVTLQPRTEEDRAQDQQRTRLLELNRLAARYFTYLLAQHPGGEPARAYVERRALTSETQEVFQLGYSLPTWNHLLTYLTTKKGYDTDEVVAAGLAVQHEERGAYDRFRGRLIFPIRNARGEVVGFGGRALGDEQPKYMNTPQTMLFDKSQVLYGLDLAREAVRQADATVVVEGYVDVITAHQHGFRNVVAPLGTALTAGHVGMLKKLSHQVYLALDADAAGQRATLRGLDAIARDQDTSDAQPTVTAQGMVRWTHDVTLRIIELPPGRDPDELIKDAPQQWRDLIAAALPVMDFYLRAYTAGLNLRDPQDQRTALGRLLPLLAQLDATQQRVYVAQAEQAIGMRAELILDMLRGQQPAPARTRPARARPQPPDASRAPVCTAPERSPPADTPSSAHEAAFLALLLRYPRAVPRLHAWLAEHTAAFPELHALIGDEVSFLLEHTPNRLLWHAWHTAGTPELPPTPDSLTSNAPPWVQALDEPLSAQLTQLMALEHPHSHAYSYWNDIQARARQLRRAQLVRWRQRLGEQITHASDDAERAQATARLVAVQRCMAQVNKPPQNPIFPDMRDALPDER